MLNNLQSNTPKKTRKRLGRGIGSGLGKTSGKGHKGQNARSGGGVRPGFEGGQIPLFQRLPKRGFKNIRKEEFSIVSLENLNKFKDGSTVGPEEFLKNGLVKDNSKKIKVLANGKLEKKLTIKAHRFSKSAESLIIKAGSKLEVI